MLKETWISGMRARVRQGERERVVRGCTASRERTRFSPHRSSMPRRGVTPTHIHTIAHETKRQSGMHRQTLSPDIHACTHGSRVCLTHSLDSACSLASWRRSRAAIDEVVRLPSAALCRLHFKARLSPYTFLAPPPPHQWLCVRARERVGMCAPSYVCGSGMATRRDEGSNGGGQLCVLTRPHATYTSRLPCTPRHPDTLRMRKPVNKRT